MYAKFHCRDSTTGDMVNWIKEWWWIKDPSLAGGFGELGFGAHATMKGKIKLLHRYDAGSF